MKPVQVGLAVLAVALLAAGVILWRGQALGGGLEVSDQRAVILPNGVAGVYMTITNRGGEEVCIVGVEVRNHPEARAEIHQTVARGEKVEMVPVEELCIPPKSSVKLRPGSYHIMVMGLNLQSGREDSLVLDLVLGNGERVEVIVGVSAAKIPE